MSSRFLSVPLCLWLTSALLGQDGATPTAGNQAAAWSSKIVELKYLDPESLRSVFSGRSYVMEANRGLGLLTVSGPPEFLKEVEETGKRLDVAPPSTPNYEITVYLLTTDPQSPSSGALPKELAALGKELGASTSGAAFRLADYQTVRVREGQPGEVKFAEPPAGAAPTLTRIKIQSAYANPAETGKSGVISLNRIECWLNKSAANTPPQPRTEGDVAASIDLTANQPALVARSGIEKPLAVIVRVNLAK